MDDTDNTVKLEPLVEKDGSHLRIEAPLGTFGSLQLCSKAVEYSQTTKAYGRSWVQYWYGKFFLFKFIQAI